MAVSFRMTKANWRRALQQLLAGMPKSALRRAECLIEVAADTATFTTQGFSVQMAVVDGAEGNVTMPLHVLRSLAATVRAAQEDPPLFSAMTGEVRMEDYTQTSDRIRTVPMSSLSAFYVPAEGGTLHVLALAAKYGVEEVGNAGLAQRLEEAQEELERKVKVAAAALADLGVEKARVRQLALDAISRKADAL